MTSCHICNSRMIEKSSTGIDGVDYNYYSCTKCGEEILDIIQLEEAAAKSKKMRA